LNEQAQRGERVPCGLVYDYGDESSQSSISISGASCKYQGMTGSFLGCTDRKGRADYRTSVCRKLSLNVKLKGANTSDGTPATEALQVEYMQLRGMQHDDSLLRNHLGYWMLRELELKASCSVPANVHINGQYDGLADLSESTDAFFLQHYFPDDQGQGTLWREMWPESPWELYYKTAKPIPGFADRKMVQEGPGGPYYALFAGLYREAKACVATKLCSKTWATRIVDKYTHKMSFVKALVGIALTANSDQPIILKHNFNFYVLEDRFYYVPWDYVSSKRRTRFSGPLWSSRR
jgi:hypothetical protein